MYCTVYQTVVRGVSPGGPQAFLEVKALQKLYQTVTERKIHPYMSVLKLPLLVDLQQKVGKPVLSIIPCPSIIAYFRKYFKLVYKTCGHSKFNHWYNVSHIHSHALSGVGSSKEVVRVYADGP
jgi:hypothetical protein